MKKGISIANGVTVGLDLADVWSDWVALDDEGAVLKRARVRTTEAKLRETFGVMRPAVIAIEVGTHSAWVERVLGSCGHTVVVANARRVALIHRNRRKNNRIDARLLGAAGTRRSQAALPDHAPEQGGAGGPDDHSQP